MTLRELLWVVVMCLPVQAGALRLDARSIFDRAVTHGISLSADRSALQLDSGELFQDDGPAAGYSYKPNLERLSPTVWIRKQLVIGDPRASSAVLMVGPGGSLKVSINGRPQALEAPRRTGFSQWQAYTFSPAALKPGVNDIVLSGAGRVWIARGDDSPVELPHRSARSADGGLSWSVDRLGPEGNVSGEYYVRIFLEHFRSQGSILLPVMDVANLAGNPLSPPLAAAGSVRVSFQAETGAQQQVAVRVRSGTTYVPRKETWSEWTAPDRSGRLRTSRGRYVQVEVTLATRDPLATPRLREITLETAPATAADWTKAVQVVDAHNEEIVRTSIPFRYEPFTHPKLKELRTRYQLDEVVRAAKTELELITKLAAWSARQWKWQEWHLDQSYPAWDALEILSKHADGKPVGGFCLQYDLVFLQACESFGFAGRAVSISNGALGLPKTGGHEPTEIWSNEFRKWIYVDGTGAWYALDEATNVPLSLWEVRRRQIRVLRGEAAEPIRIVKIEKTVHNWDGLAKDLAFAELRLIPRSNFLEQKSPLPLNQGFLRAWFWTGHYVWSDAEVPAELLHANRVTQHGNFEWTLNQARYALEVGTAPGEVLVHLDTETPGFETFLAEIDGAAQRPVSAVFPWKLHPGLNRLKVWPRNNAGRDGIPSWIALRMPVS
jgi:hypothetical protein